MALLPQERTKGLKLVILTAGLGERLRPLTYLVPKPYLPLKDGLIIEKILKWAINELSFDEKIIVLAYMADKIITLMKKPFRDAKFIVSDQLLGTAGQLWYVRDFVDDNDNVLVINGDVITNVSLRNAYDFHRQHNADLTIISVNYPVPIRYGIIEYGDNGVFKNWVEKPIIRLPIVAGIYIMRGSLIKRLRREKLDMNVYVKELVNQNFRVYAFVGGDQYVDLGTIQDYLNYIMND